MKASKLEMRGIFLNIIDVSEELPNSRSKYINKPKTIHLFHNEGWLINKCNYMLPLTAISGHWYQPSYSFLAC